MRRSLLALGAAALLGCNFVGDNHPPSGIGGSYHGLIRSTQPVWTGSITAGLNNDDLSVTGTLTISSRDCATVFVLSGTRDARYLRATLTSSTSTLSLTADTLMNRIAGNFVTAEGMSCTGARGTLDLVHDPN